MIEDQTQKFLEALFEPGEIFEVRVKTQDEKGAKQTWLHTNKMGMFIHTHLPIHDSHKRHVWVGILPRTRVGDSSPTSGRALWADLNASITTRAQAIASLDASKLPKPSMIVNSGNGYHLYWLLDKAHTPEELHPHLKAIHSVLPADATHDPTRVMRVPGTNNWKANTPKPCLLEDLDSSKIYSLASFPKTEVSHPVATDAPTIYTELTDEDFQLFVANWLDGQKHHMAVGVAGYLRKNLNYPKTETLVAIGRIHQAAGYSWPDDNLTKVVEDTYKQFPGKIAGLALLREFGVVPEVKDSFTFSFKQPRKPKIKLIDFSEDIKAQEFYMHGLVGPGLLTLWAAEAKTGKSFAAMQIGHALATGTPLWGWDVPKAVRVLYFQGELSRGMVAERAKAMFGEGILRNPRQFAMTDKPDELLDLTSNPEVLNDLAEHYDVVIVDPISAFSANDENSSSTVRSTLSMFDTLKAKGKAVILVHHTKKLASNRDGTPVVPSFSDIRGSGAWFAMADALALQFRTSDAGTTRTKFMFRAAQERPPLDLYRLDHGGFTDSYREYLAAFPTMRVDISSVN